MLCPNCQQEIFRDDISEEVLDDEDLETLREEEIKEQNDSDDFDFDPPESRKSDDPNATLSSDLTLKDDESTIVPGTQPDGKSSPSEPASTSDEFEVQNTDPMATLQAPGDLRASIVTRSQPDPNRTARINDLTVRDEDSLFEEPTSKQAPQQPLDPTLIPPKAKSEDTVINPDAAREAAERFSEGLDTVIPPRSISRMDQPGRFQDYKVEKKLGSGAFGVIFRALQVPLERNVAVKVLQGTDSESETQNRKLKNEFLQEAQFTGRLEHPNIVPIHDIGLTVDSNGRVNPFYAMKEIRGVSWLHTIHKKTRAENLTVFKHVVNAIGFAHDKNILHCDLKPANIMLGEYGEVLVVDWGQAIDLSQENTIRPGGTPAYISPEMAKYWCDIHLDNRESSAAREQVGHRSDVYLLGALLFEIVTGHPPHGESPNDPPYELVRSAAENEIRSFDKYVDDELMQIALSTLRAGEGESIETVDALLAAIKKYETRILSIELRKRADELLETAKENSDYDDYQRARFGFEESLEKWDGNRAAESGLRDARLSCAELALKDQNFELGINMLEAPHTEDELSLKQQLTHGKNRRDRQKKLVRALALGLIASIIVGIGLNTFMIRLNFQTMKLRELALAEKLKVEREVVPLRKEVELQKQEVERNLLKIAENEEVIAQLPIKLKREQEKFENQLTTEKLKLADKLKDEQEQLDRQLAEEQRKHALQLLAEQRELDTQLRAEQQKFESEKTELEKQKTELNWQIADLDQSSQLLRYKSQMTTVVQKLQAGDYRETRQLLDRFEDKTPWEWARLNLRTHREIEAIYADQPLVTFAASADGSRFAMAYKTKIEVRATNKFNATLVNIPVKSATAIAFSSNGKKLAIARPANSPRDAGTIWIINLANPAKPVQERVLEGQSQQITKLQFSDDSRRFLSVGIPSKLRKSSAAGLDEELMIWDDTWNRIDAKLIVGNGSQPVFTDAGFSADGRRVVTTNPNGLSRDQVLHVFEQSGESYEWLATSPTTGINVANFDDAKGNSIIGCARSKRSGAYSLINWRLTLTSPDRSRLASTEFINTSTRPTASITRLSQLDQKVLSINRTGSWLVTGGQDKQTTIWDWKTKTPTRFSGHSRGVDFCALISGDDYRDNVLLSVASGANPEILKTDLSKFQTEVQTKKMGRVGFSDFPSPTTFSKSRLTQQLSFGNDHGQASVSRPTAKGAKNIQWEVSAWKNHFLSDDYLFAQSRGDYFYKFSRGTGELESVLTRLTAKSRNGKRPEIIQFEVSDDGRTALVVTDDTTPEFHIWNLETERKIRTINYGNENIFGTATDKKLAILRLSPDGQSVIGGKVGIFVWSTATGTRQPLPQPKSKLARNPVSAIAFVNQGTNFLVSWKDRVDLFDLTANKVARRFNTKDIPYNKNAPNLFDAQVIGGRTLALARWAGQTQSDTGIILVDLASNDTIAEFPFAKFASFSNLVAGDVMVVNKPGAKHPIQKWVAATQQLKTVAVEKIQDAVFKGRFKTLDRAFEHQDRQIVLQSPTKNEHNSLRRDWNTISLRQDGSIGDLRVIAKPEIEYSATAGNVAVTLNHGTIRLWRLDESTVRPSGIIPGFYETCSLSPDETTLLAISNNSNQVIGFSLEGEQKFKFETEEDELASSVGWHSTSLQIAIGFESGKIEFWNCKDNAPKLIDRRQISNSPISEIRFAESSPSLVAVSKSTGQASVLHQNDRGIQQIVLRHRDGQQIATGDISSDGRRIITGTDKGRMTVWNSENLTLQNSKAKINSDERELLNLQNIHQSSVQFARFLTSPDQTDIVSAESGDGNNQYLIWKTQK